MPRARNRSSSAEADLLRSGFDFDTATAGALKACLSLAQASRRDSDGQVTTVAGALVQFRLKVDDFNDAVLKSKTACAMPMPMR